MAQRNAYEVGDRVRLTATFTDEDDALTDPTEVTIRVQDPSGNEASDTYNGGAGNVTRVSLGVFRLFVTIDESGRWHWKANGTGALVAAQERSFTVRPSEFAAL